MKRHIPDGPTDVGIPSASPAQASRAEFEAQISAQRERNASAVMRAQQKVARDRPKPRPTTQVDALADWIVEKLGSPFNPPWKPAVAATWFMMLTGWRCGEVLGLQWSEVDLAERTARLADTRTGTSIRPLSALACAVIQAQPKVGDGVFPQSSEPYRVLHLCHFPCRQERQGRVPVAATPDAGEGKTSMIIRIRPHDLLGMYMSYCEIEVPPGREPSAIRASDGWRRFRWPCNICCRQRQGHAGCFTRYQVPALARIPHDYDTTRNCGGDRTAKSR
jgi:hypothetical protein